MPIPNLQSHPDGETSVSASAWAPLRVAGVAVLAAASAALPKLALPAAFLTFVCYLSLPRGLARGRARNFGLVLAVSGVAATVGVIRFVVTEAVPGIVQGGKDAAAKAAISRLREIVFAEDAMRKHALLDPDHDGVGSAAFIAELGGTVALRKVATVAPILNQRYHELVRTRSGSAAKVAGYLYMVCLPKLASGFTAEPTDPVDEERAERRFLAYAWPAVPTGRIEAAFFIDEHERILVSNNIDGKDPRYVGPDFPPSCEIALQDQADWQPWKNKKPRATLPGENPSPEK